MHRQADPEYIRDYYACDAQEMTGAEQVRDCLSEARHVLDSAETLAAGVHAMADGLTGKQAGHLVDKLRRLRLSLNAAWSAACQMEDLR